MESAAWRAIAGADSRATAAHRPELWRLLASTLDGFTLRFIEVEDDGTSLGGGAVFVRRRGGSSWLHVLPFMLSGAPLAVPGAEKRVDLAFAAALEGMRRELQAVGGEWALQRGVASAHDAEALEGVAGDTRWLETSVIDLGSGIGAAWQRLESTARSQVHHARAAGLVFAEEPEAIDEVYVLHLAQARRWSAHRAIPLDLARRLLEAPAGRQPPARLFTVRDSRRLVAAMFYLDHPREILAWWSGSREDARARHAMTFLYWSTAEWAAAAGRMRLDLGGSPGLPSLAAYKRSLGAVSVRYPVRWLAPAEATPATRAIAALERWVRRGRHRGESA